eukprot:TRINITY_DN74349_c0_g1_i1.p1 TRINITY_DN74349_c0_g1~~TRINITY_DN74349_c0_g1_i1.p1  ORF type:complete len:323 (+),score=62.26 TRINITY_DN74349_c0_g1_i1:52-1020(+)
MSRSQRWNHRQQPVDVKTDVGVDKRFAAIAPSAFVSDASPKDWLETPVLQGSGKRAGQMPRGAGVIAICEIEGAQLVCICEKRNGKQSFPKGGVHHHGNQCEAIYDAAKREWQEETGISLARLRFLDGAYIDEPGIGTRYLVACCQQAAPDSLEPDTQSFEWQPPYEDKTDNDPIVRAFWISTCEVFAGRARLSRVRTGFLTVGLDLLKRAATRAPGEAAVLRMEPASSAIASSVPERPAMSSAEKDLLKLAKKLKEIKKLSALQSSNALSLDKQQREKLAKHDEVLIEFASLISTLPDASTMHAKFADLLAQSSEAARVSR